MTDTISRRGVLIGACSCSALALAACSTGPAESPAGSGDDHAGIPLADVPVGGGIVVDVDGVDVVVTQPEAGEVRAFSSVCTHEGCAVRVGDGIISCPCHGSEFDLDTGDATAGPAEDPLPAYEAVIDADHIVVTVS